MLRIANSALDNGILHSVENGQSDKSNELSLVSLFYSLNDVAQSDVSSCPRARHLEPQQLAVSDQHIDAKCQLILHCVSEKTSPFFIFTITSSDVGRFS